MALGGDSNERESGKMTILGKLRKKLKEQVEKYLAVVSPEQRTWLARGLLFMGCCGLCKGTQTIWPSIGLALIWMVTFVASTICIVNLLEHTPQFRAALPWCTPILVGGSLNFAVILANGGFIPATCQEVADGFYIPMDGANLSYLADWVWGFVSPGDILMVIGFLGIIGTLAWKQKQHKLAEQA
jgi:hypothetical protein